MSSLEKMRKSVTTKKTKKHKRSIKASHESSTKPSLPNDLLVSCFARISRLYYPTLSLVSKRFRSILALPELYKARSPFHLSENCLYVCLKFLPDPNPRWFTLCLKPNRALTKDTSGKKSNGYILALVPIPHSLPVNSSSLVVVGSNIYNIGGPKDKAASSSVSILDCKSHTWHDAPSMRVKRMSHSISVLDGKIYVVGGCKDNNSSNWIEVFDPKTQTWDKPLLSRGDAAKWISKIWGSSISAGIDGKLYMIGEEKSVAYNPKDGSIAFMELGIDLDWECSCYCVIEDVLYCYRSGIFGWYDAKERLWRDLRGLQRRSNIDVYSFVKIADYGGKMALLWDKYVSCSGGYKEKGIWCAVIALEKRNTHNRDDIWGNVEWLDTVLTVPKSYEFVCALGATI